MILIIGFDVFSRGFKCVQDFNVSFGDHHSFVIYNPSFENKFPSESAPFLSF